MKLTNYIAVRLKVKTAQHLLMLTCLVLMTLSTGCATSGTLAPHQAFRQNVTPFQGYYQGQPAGFGQDVNGGVGGSGTVNNFGSFNAQQGFGQTNPAFNGGFNSQFPPGMPAGGVNFQPAINGGFSSGSC